MCSVVSLIISGHINQIVVAEVHTFYVCPEDIVLTKYTHFSDILNSVKSSELEIVDTSCLLKKQCITFS